jgi:hypothetical protein
MCEHLFGEYVGKSCDPVAQGAKVHHADCSDGLLLEGFASCQVFLEGAGVLSVLADDCGYLGASGSSWYYWCISRVGWGYKRCVG